MIDFENGFYLYVNYDTINGVKYQTIRTPFEVSNGKLIISSYIPRREGEEFMPIDYPFWIILIGKRIVLSVWFSQIIFSSKDLDMLCFDEIQRLPTSWKSSSGFVCIKEINLACNALATSPKR